MSEESKTEVFLEDVHIGVSPTSGRIYVGTQQNETQWDQKVNRSDEFLASLLNWSPPGYVRDVKTNDGKQFRIAIVEIKQAGEEDVERLKDSGVLDKDGNPPEDQ